MAQPIILIHKSCSFSVCICIACFEKRVIETYFSKRHVHSLTRTKTYTVFHLSFSWGKKTHDSACLEGDNCPKLRALDISFVAPIVAFALSLNFVIIKWRDSSAGIFKQSMGARNRVGIGLSFLPRQATQPGGIGSLESILGVLKSLKIRAQDSREICTSCVTWPNPTNEKKPA